MGPLGPHNVPHWNHPSSWPLYFDVWLLVLLVFWIAPAWRWFVRERTGNWRGARGVIESARVIEVKPSFWSSGKSDKTYHAELAYAYSIEGVSNNGLYEKKFYTTEEADAFIRDLQGRAVAIHYNPAKPAVSIITESDLEALLSTRAPGISEQDALASRQVSGWTSKLIWPLLVLSVLGIVLSMAAEALAWMGYSARSYFWLLNVGIYVVWMPSFLITMKRVGSARRRNFWRVALGGTPVWMRFAACSFFCLALIGWALPHFEAGAQGSAIASKGELPVTFAAGWLAYYSTALAMLYAALKAGSGLCPDGHSLPVNTASCPICGQRAFPAKNLAS